MAGNVDIGIDTQTNDISHKNGLIQYVNMDDEVIQRVRTCLRRIAGEWFLDTDAGLPYFGGQMLGGKDIEYVKLIIRESILSVSGVLKITNINILIDSNSKKCSVYVEIELNEKIYKITEDL